MVPITDCGSVFRSAEAGPKHATHEKRPWAAVWADLRPHWLGPPVRVKAHLTKEQSAERGQLDLWQGNAAADSAAKKRAATAGTVLAARCHGCGSAEAVSGSCEGAGSLSPAGVGA